MATLATLRTDLIDRVGLLVNDERIPASSLNRSLNKGLQRLSMELPWPHLQVFTTIPLLAGTALYPLPANFSTVITLGTNNIRLTYVSLAELISYKNVQATPAAFAIEGTQIRFMPVPSHDGTADLVYARLEPALSADGDSPLLPDVYSDLLVTYAALYQATRLKDQHLLASLEALRKEMLQEIADNYRQSQQTPRIVLRKDAYIYPWFW